MKALVIEDDADVRDVVSVCISIRWPQAKVLSAEIGRKGLSLAEDEAPDIIILDIGLPDFDGIQVLQRLRAFTGVPVVMLTGRSRDVDVATFLREGADDYVAKPFRPMELVARIDAVLRRSRGQMHSFAALAHSDDLVMDFGAAEVVRAGERVDLTLTELKILRHMVANAQRVVTYRSLTQVVWDMESSALPEIRLVRVHVRHLRVKLGDSAASPKYNSNVRGMGYKFIPAPHAVTPVVP